MAQDPFVHVEDADDDTPPVFEETPHQITRGAAANDFGYAPCSRLRGTALTWGHSFDTGFRAVRSVIEEEACTS
jgi:hypothetical protein